MGSVKVTVYGRVKPCLKNALNQEYQIKSADNEDQITFLTNKISSGKKTYRFSKIFSEDASQEEVFETVAKPIIKSVLTGYNGTIFTYGQTGSGKTYTMTGDLEGWLNPGLIPRTVQEIFKQKQRDTPITITYCEIYNEHVYDLIRVDPLDPDLPHARLLEDSSGITHFRNLSVHLVESAFEALQLLVRGDANKMVAETSSNSRSSRSHVIFSIGLNFPHPTETKLCLKPVLYLVDLAGSEKLSKCKASMNNPMETRYINLSLHYLEQVLIALRQPGRSHIPYRNSLMTALLRNSLGGNCITAMIATFSPSMDDLDETLQTCRFAERIALIKNEIKLNELIDPQKEIASLRKENDKLRAQLKIIGISQTGEELTDRDRGRCMEMVKNFIKDNDIFDLPLKDIKRLECCFHLMREEIIKKNAKETGSKEVEKRNSVLELMKIRAAKMAQNHPQEERLTDDSMTKMKSNEVKGGRKRTPIDLPKINVTYKRWKSTEEISENNTAGNKNSQTSEIKPVLSNVSDSSIISRKVSQNNSETSLKKDVEDEPGKEKPGELAHKPLVGFVDVRVSGTSTKENYSNIRLKDLETSNELERKSKTLLRQTSNVYVKAEVSHPVFTVSTESPLSSNEKFVCQNIRELISVGIQVEDNEMWEVSADEISISSNAETNSNNSIDQDVEIRKSLPLTGDKEVDEEIVKFYKSRYETLKKN